MKKLIFPILLAASSLFGQTIQTEPPPRDPSVLAQPIGTPQSALVQPEDLIFPHLAFGGGWNTTIVLVNLSDQTVAFHQYFFSQSGQPLPITFRSIPQNIVVTGSVIVGTLPPNQSFNFQLFDTGLPTQVGWSGISYDSDPATTRLGGYAIFQRTFAAGAAFEALVPLSSIADYRFYMRFDNRAGFVTSMAILNPLAPSATVNFTFRDTFGNILATRTLTLPSFTQQAFSLVDFAPETNGNAGVLYVTGSTTSLSALGFGFNPLGAFATIPIMNWSVMFPPQFPGFSP